MENLITCVKSISSGSPTLVGRRLTVYNIVSSLYVEKDLKTIEQEMEVNLDQIEQAHRYCAALHCIFDERRLNFCSNCILRDLPPKQIAEFEDVYISSRGNVYELNIKFGAIDIQNKGWAMAKDNLVVIMNQW